MYAVGDTVADCVTGTATDGDNETDANGAGDIDCEADRVAGLLVIEIPMELLTLMLAHLLRKILLTIIPDGIPTRMMAELVPI